jgi:Tfp pilus assembly protein PilN
MIPPPLSLDYRRAPPGRHRPGWLLLVLGALTASALLAWHAGLRARIETQTAELAQLVAASEAQVPEEDPASPPRLPAARWEALFAALESADDETVTLLSLHPVAGELQLAGEARDNDAAVDYVARLNTADSLAGANLTQTEVLREHPQQPVRFTVRAAWTGATP